MQFLASTLSLLALALTQAVSAASPEAAEMAARTVGAPLAARTDAPLNDRFDAPPGFRYSWGLLYERVSFNNPHFISYSKMPNAELVNQPQVDQCKKKCLASSKKCVFFHLIVWESDTVGCVLFDKIIPKSKVVVQDGKYGKLKRSYGFEKKIK